MVDHEVALRTVAELLEPVEERRTSRRVCGNRGCGQISYAVGTRLGAGAPCHDEQSRADEDRPARGQSMTGLIATGAPTVRRPDQEFDSSDPLKPVQAWYEMPVICHSMT